MSLRCFSSPTNSSNINFEKCNRKLIDITDKDKIHELIENYHLGNTNHRGIDETFNRLSRQYYWLNQKSTIQNLINNCEFSQVTKYERRALKLPLNIMPTASKPFEIIHMETITFENNKCLTLIDAFLKYGHAYKFVNVQGVSVCNTILKFFSHYCIPSQIIGDNRLEFNNTLVKELLENHKIKIHFTSSQHPQSNGMIERFHLTLVEHIRLLNNRAEFEEDNL